MEVIPCIRIMPLELLLATLSSSSADSSCSHARYAMVFVEDHNTCNRAWAARENRVTELAISRPSWDF